MLSDAHEIQALLTWQSSGCPHSESVHRRAVEQENEKQELLQAIAISSADVLLSSQPHS